MKSLYVREMTVGMLEHAAVSPGVSVMGRCLSLVTRGSLRRVLNGDGDGDRGTRAE